MHFTKAALDLLRTSVSTALDTFTPLTLTYIDENPSKPSIMNPVHLNADLIPEHENTATPINNSDNYAITSDEDTSTDTDKLLATIECLTSELQFERNNNATMDENLRFHNDQHEHKFIPTI